MLEKILDSQKNKGAANISSALASVPSTSKSKSPEPRRNTISAKNCLLSPTTKNNIESQSCHRKIPANILTGKKKEDKFNHQLINQFYQEDLNKNENILNDSESEENSAGENDQPNPKKGEFKNLTKGFKLMYVFVIYI